LTDSNDPNNENEIVVVDPIPDTFFSASINSPSSNANNRFELNW
jgi:hypothetical protein